MSNWSKLGTKYVCYGNYIVGIVWQDGEFWRNQVIVKGELVDRGEWLDRETAIGNCSGAMSRACHFRRFEKDPPELPGDVDCDDEDDDDDED